MPNSGGLEKTRNAPRDLQSGGIIVNAHFFLENVLLKS